MRASAHTGAAESFQKEIASTFGLAAAPNVLLCRANAQLRTITRGGRGRGNDRKYIEQAFSEGLHSVSLSAGLDGERFHFFSLSSFGRNERMVKAEFRWFRKKQKFYLGKSYGPHFCKVKRVIKSFPVCVVSRQTHPLQSGNISHRLFFIIFFLIGSYHIDS